MKVRGPARPQGGEDEEDLLRAQEAFQATADKSQPAATARRGRPPVIWVGAVSGGSAAASSSVGQAAEDEAGKAVETSQARRVQFSEEDQVHDAPARDIIRLDGTESPSAPAETATKPKSRFAELRGARAAGKVEQNAATEGPANDSEAARRRLDTQDTHITKVLADIMERRDVPTAAVASSASRMRGVAFPVAEHRTPGLEKTAQAQATGGGAGGKKKSLFALDFERRRKDAAAAAGGDGDVLERRTADAAQTAVESVVLTADARAKLHQEELDRVAKAVNTSSADIHTENMRTLLQMTPEEIAAEQEELRRMLGGDVADLVKARKHRKNAKASSEEAAGEDRDSARTGSQAEPGLSGSANEATKAAARTETQRAGILKTSTGVASSGGAATKGAITKVTVDALGNMPIRLPFTPDKRWLNMDQVEVEKLEWMQPLSRPSKEAAGAKQQKSRIERTWEHIRFDFSGVILPPTVEVSTDLALHHHGEEEGRAGYTLKEILHLSRSAVASQRAWAFTVLTRILNAVVAGAHETQADAAGQKEGARSHDMDIRGSDIVAALAEHEFSYGLRISLDDQTEQVLQAAVPCMAAWVSANLREPLPTTVPAAAAAGSSSSHEQESESDDGPSVVFSAPGHARRYAVGGDVLYRAYEVVTCSSAPPPPESKREMSDRDWLAHDLVAGYVKMQLPERLRYVLEVCRNLTNAVTPILETLVIMATHSQETAKALAKCPRLLACIHRDFVKVPWPPAAPQTGRITAAQEAETHKGQAADGGGGGGGLAHQSGLPHPSALRFARVVCASSRDMAELMHAEGLLDTAVRYVVLDPARDIGDNCRDTRKLGYRCGIEALQLWRTCLKYGIFQHALLAIYPVLTMHLASLSRLPLAADSEEDALRLLWASSLLNVVESAADVAFDHLGSEAAEGTRETEADGDRGIDASHVMGWLPQVAAVYCGLVHGLAGSSSSGTPAPLLDVASSAAHALASLYRVASKLRSDAVAQPERLSDELLQALKSSLTGPFAASVFACAFHGPSHARPRVEQRKDSQVYPAAALANAEIRAHYDWHASRRQWAQAVDEVQSAGQSAANYVCSLARLARSMCDSHHRYSSRVASALLPILFASSPPGDAGGAKHGVGLWRNVALGSAVPSYASRLQGKDSARRAMCHMMCNVVTFSDWLLHSRWVDMADDVRLDAMARVHRRCVWLLSVLPTGFEFEACSLVSAVALHPDYLGHIAALLGGEPGMPWQVRSLIQSMAVDADALAEVAPIIMAQIGTPAGVRASELRSDGPASSLQSLFLGSRRALFAGGTQLPLPADWVFIPFVRCYDMLVDTSIPSAERPSEADATVLVREALKIVLLLEQSNFHYMASLSAGTKVARLMTIFVAGAEIFRDDQVHAMLHALLVLYARSGPVDFGNIPGLAFMDLFTALVYQYGSVSYGDKVYQGYVMLPLEQRGFTMFKTLMWDECVDCTAALSLSTDDLPLPIDRYLFPAERDPTLLNLYMRGIMEGTVRKHRAPVPYWLAVHHLVALLFGGENPERQQQEPLSPQQQERLDLCRGDCMRTLCIAPVPVCDERQEIAIRIVTAVSMGPTELLLYDVVHDILSYVYTGPASFPPSSSRPALLGRVRAMDAFRQKYLAA